MDGYTIVKFVHVLSAIIAVGFNASYGLWLGRAANDERVLPFVFSTLHLVDNVSNAFYGLLLVTGRHDRAIADNEVKALLCHPGILARRCGRASRPGAAAQGRSTDR